MTQRMAQRFELERVFSMPSARGVDRIVRAWFVPEEPCAAGAVVVDRASYLERGASTRTPRTSP
jgi:hypothetical protein